MSTTFRAWVIWDAHFRLRDRSEPTKRLMVGKVAVACVAKSIYRFEGKNKGRPVYAAWIGRSGHAHCYFSEGAAKRACEKAAGIPSHERTVGS